MEICSEARSWVGTPFHHQGRIKGQSVDCAGLIIGVADAIGAMGDFEDLANYPRTPDGTMREVLNKYLVRKLITDQKPGYVLFFAFCRIPQHLGILTDVNTIIHAYEPEGKVVEHIYDDAWRRMVRGVYAFRMN